MVATALRGMDVPAGPDGTRVLRPPRQTYADGAEAEVLAILQAATDVSSTSAELIGQAHGWAQSYHLSPQRSVVLDFLDIPPGTRVLEIGAGCGPVTRHLGERGAEVDAIEPMPARAAANRERCRDLPNVQVWVGELEDVPDEPSYDLAVVVGVLEYVAGGSADRQPYLDFLAGLARRLVPGGQLALAIENQLGVKYLAGAAEDHTNRIFDGVEGYPWQRYPGQPGHGVARTFSRRALVQLLADAGLHTDRVLAAFPDYKMTRAVLDESLADIDPSLAYRIPQFPSPDPVVPRPRMADEFSLWRSLVEAGLAGDFPNSFLVCATTAGGGTHSTPLWPAGQYAGFATLVRGPGTAARTRLVADPQGPMLVRDYLGEPPAGTPIVVQAGRRPYRPGRDLIDLLAAVDDTELLAALRGWTDLLFGLDFDGGAPVDAMPHNVIIAADGGLALIDDEFRVRDWTVEQVYRRGLYWTANKLAAVTVPERWTGLETVRDLALRLGRDLGSELPADWLDETIAREAQLQAQVIPSVPEEELARRLTANVDRSLAEAGLGDRVWEHAHDARDLSRRHDELLAAVSRAETEGSRVELERRALEAELQVARNETARVELDRQALETEAHRLEQDRRRLEAEVVRVEGERKALEQQVAELSELNEFLAGQLEQRTVELRTLTGRRRSFPARLRRR